MMKRSKGKTMDKKESNIRIFTDTERLCCSNKTLITAIDNSTKSQYILYETDPLQTPDKPFYTTPAQILVSKKRSLGAAAAYSQYKVCVHNFASATHPGGGVTRGSSAQEEAICRCSTLYFNINAPKCVNHFHNKHRQDLKAGKLNALYNDDCIFTPAVCVFKSDTASPELLPEKDWYQVDVITCAAPNLREHPSNPMNPDAGSKPIKLKDRELLDLHLKRISRICNIAIKEQEEVLILGAFGCGAFRNDPRIVAEAMARIVEKYQFYFKIIEFAVYCAPWDTKNYEIFSQRLGR
jgi:uncharacterized protein (TIGR02452 family)